MRDREDRDLVVVEEVPSAIVLADPGDIVTAISRVALVRQHARQLIRGVTTFVLLNNH